jgi:hypothetical protein
LTCLRSKLVSLPNHSRILWKAIGCTRRDERVRVVHS